MKKQSHHCAAALLPLAFASLGAWAQSSVNVYGIAAVEVVRVSGVNLGTQVVSQSRLDNSQDTNSRLGFKGSEDLGDGLSAIFDLESGINIDTGTTNTAFFNRGSYVGLSSKRWGTLTFGRQWNTNDDIMANYFVFDGYAAFRFREFDFLSDLVNNAVKYVSPTIGGASVHALVAPGEGVTGRTEEISANYNVGGFNGGASYRYAKGSNGQVDKLASAGLSMVVGNFRPHAGYSYSDSKASGFPKANAFDGGVTWAPMPLWVFDFDYVGRNQLGTGNNSHFVRARAAYSLSKRTSVIANLITLKNDGTATEHFYGNGAPGRDQNVVSLGLVHMF